MRSIGLKLVAVLLAALCLFAAAAGVTGLVLLGELEQHNTSMEEQWSMQLRDYARAVAWSKVQIYTLYEKSTAPEEVIDYAVIEGYVVDLGLSLLSNLKLAGYVITNGNGVVKERDGSMELGENRELFRFEDMQSGYFHIHLQRDAQQYLSAGTAEQSNFGYGELYSVLWTERRVENQYTVEVVLEQTGLQGEWQWGFLLERSAGALPVALVGSLLLFALCMVYLCWAAGRKKGTSEIRPAGFNALPLDIYALAVGLAGTGGAALLVNLVLDMTNSGAWNLIWLIAVLAYFICLLPVLYICAVAAQIKAENRFWWRRSVVGFAAIWLWRGIKWLYRRARGVLRMVPAMWQWLLVFAAMVLIPVFMLMLVSMQHSYQRQRFFIFCFFGSLVLDVAMVIYGSWCFATIGKGAKRMASGNLNTKIDTKNLYGSFRTCAEDLNSMSDAALIAARQQLKSERMKTELITNVSHDIKTPLTSIINYVDLLQKPHTEEEGQQYLEVLSRQSGRMKKLVEDLMEMSKAASGNVNVEIADVNAAEAVHQALGEFTDKLKTVGLDPVFRYPEENVLMQADGRLAWRVMGNLLSNAVKYAMPGTRLYVDVVRREENVQISFKNISAEPLNISAEELMERFVRGDASRNTEGSGLGLNIAAGLMQAQGGSMDVLVDGDLFKVTLSFPASCS